MEQTTTQIFHIMEYIKAHQLPSIDIEQLISELIKYHSELEEWYKIQEENEDTKNFSLI